MKFNCLVYLKIMFTLLFSSSIYAQTIIAIDAGHGGKDPGAIGNQLGLQEKQVTLSIAKELKLLLDANPNFKSVMTRSGDYFIEVPKRSEIARKNRANYLISIHADISPNSKNIKGASVWILSNKRANNEMAKWLEDNEKQSELLGGAGTVLANANERYLSQTVLDLQFSYSQKTGYELGKVMLKKLSNVTTLVKTTPQHASLSVLRSPDIPSILIEVGFLSNAVEEKKLSNIQYRKNIAKAIYQGIVEYTLSIAPKKEKVNKKKTEDNKKTIKYHQVQKGETLYSISKIYNTTPDKLSEINNITNNKILVGQKLRIK